MTKLLLVVTRTNEQLFPLVMAGDQEARDELIVLNMPLVVFKVDAYLGCFEHLFYLREDLITYGNIALIEAVDLIKNGKVQNRNLVGYLSIAIQKQIGQAIDGEMFATSKHSARFWRAQGDDPKPLHKVPNSEYVLSQLENDPRKEQALLENILESCESDEERAVVDLRIKGYKDSEISKQLDIPLTTVFMLRRELYQRLIAAGDITSD